jgi:hypothetical protein
MLGAQLRVFGDLDRALSGKPPAEVPPGVGPEPLSERPRLKSFLDATWREEYEIARRWYEREHLTADDPKGGNQ